MFSAEDFSGMWGLVLIFMVVMPVLLAAEIRERSEVPVQYLWNLEDLYPSDAAWDQARLGMAGEMAGIERFKGRLGGSGAEMLACLEFDSRISKEFGRLRSYAAMRCDQDTRDSQALGMRQQLEQLGTDYHSRASFIVPEIAAMEEGKIEEFLAAEPGLQVHRMTLHDIQRTKAHRLSDKEEKILAESSLLANTPASIYQIFSNADFPYPKLTLSDGQTVTLNQAGYSRYRAVPERQDREKVFQAFWGSLNRFQRTFGVQLYSSVKRDMFYARTRHYNNTLESKLDEFNIPVAVYSALLENVNQNLDSLHRYLRLKQRMLGVEKLKYSDVYAPVVQEMDRRYSVEEAKKLILAAVEPMGPEYAEVVRRAFTERWIDMYPTAGKQSGAYSSGSAYEVHPYILMNYNERYNDVSTLIHELGHTMHSYYANQTQPYATADYSLFVAEVASTFNEALLMNRMLAEIQEVEMRLNLLMNYVEGVRQTVFRQSQFAEFELRMHETAERGEPLTGEILSRMYGEILKKYYGHELGVCEIHDLYCIEWAFIPHFYRHYYVYQYATSFTASTMLAERVLKQEAGAVEKYIELIAAGGSDYPVNLLQKAGVDMTTPAPFAATMEAMNRAMDEVEILLEKRKQHE